jgi:hypothetical protein
MRSLRSSRSCCNETRDGPAISAVIPREGGGSSTPQLLGSIIAVSGILGHPPSRVTTIECAVAISRPEKPEVCIDAAPQERMQGMPGARCTRGLVCKMHKRKRTRAYRFSGGNPAFPAQWLYGLCRALPGERIRLVTVVSGSMARLRPVGPTCLRGLGASNGRQDHTVLPYARSVVRLARREPLTSLIPPCDCLTRRRIRVHHIPSRVS